jgi:hypothetical protein
MTPFTPLDPAAEARWERWRHLEREVRAADVTIVAARARAALAATVEAQVPDGPRALEARAYLAGRRALALRDLDAALRRRSLARARRARLHASLGP